MVYLSRIWLNPLRTKAQRILRDPQTAHAAILGGIAHQPVTERILWRLEPDPATRHRLGLLVLTESRPAWDHLVEQAGWPGVDEPQALIRPYEPLLDQLAVGRQYAFRLKANPVSSTRNPEAPSGVQKERLAAGPRPRGVRVAHRTAAHQLDWFTDRVDRWGFTAVPGASATGDGPGIPQLRLVGRDRLSFRKGSGEARGEAAGGRGTKRGASVVLQVAVFDGILQVTDAQAARRTLLNGVGPGKAYGLGLLTLAPPVTPTPTPGSAGTPQTTRRTEP
ncbi:MAG: type I-E CRISPR-associated protein Cas6/Cse3/CasE [Dactylosporangium sp.]|nr:type I-E CRISPR-associated protein Cas6/Cse3/CasE [Dactylosporangium sp.]NNJ63448.1 type I-E CRISPR-associated protein Cas6/Cse3/CasE [Dactylosporangium sp.]